MEKHCIHVEKVFDWVSRSVKLTKREMLTEPIVEHDICVNICMPCGKKTIVWSAEKDVHAFGTVTVAYEQGCGQHMDVFINGEYVFSLQEGESRSVYLCQHIQSLGRVKVEIEGTTCTPRVEQQVDKCPPHIIPSCPL